MIDPQWRKIGEELRELIEAGKLRPGTRLVDTELQRQFEVGPGTVRKALNWLVNLHLVTVEPGRGTFVAEEIAPFMVTMSAPVNFLPGGGEGLAFVTEVQVHNRTPDEGEVSVAIEGATPEVARLLHLSVGSQVVSRRQLRTIDGKPWSMQVSYYPREFIARGAARLDDPESLDQGVVRYLKESLGIEQAGYRDIVVVRALAKAEAGIFRLPDDGTVAAIVTYRAGYSQDGTPFRVTITVLPADRNRLVYEIGDVPLETLEQEKSSGRLAARGLAADDTVTSQLRGLVAVDVAGFGDPLRDDQMQIHVRSSLYRILESAFARSGITWKACYHEDRGDGAMVVVSPQTPTAALLEPLAGELQAAVRWHNRVSSDPAKIRLRMAVHAGQIHFDLNGVTGTALIHLFRLLDADELKAALASSSADIALIASDYIHDSVIRHGIGRIDPARYRQVQLAVKETHTRAWIQLLGPVETP